MEQNKNKIRMRVCKDEEAVCKVCGKPKSKSLEIFELSFTEKQIIRICDDCNNELFNKSLRASCMVSHRLKSNRDIKIIQERNKQKGLKKV